MSQTFHPCRPGSSPPVSQKGVVLVISLIMLVVISLLATMSIRSATSSESVAGNTRTTLLATQAAEMALQYCEKWTLQINGKAMGLTGTPPEVQAAPGAGSHPAWNSLSNWDNGATAALYQVPSAIVNQDTLKPTYARPPECMIEKVQVINSAGALTDTSTRVITARGFGPDESGTVGTRPSGSEVWLQSTIELN